MSIKVTFYGAAGEVTGSHYVLESAKSRIAIDCGLFQGTKSAHDDNYQPFPYDPSQLQALILTHAHLDHVGRLPKLVKDGFRGKIFTHPATADLAALILEDAAKVMIDHLEPDEEPLYHPSDVEAVLDLFELVEYQTSVKITADITAKFFDAGHILGSASVRVESAGQSVVFSGDIGNHPVPLLNQPVTPEPADLVIMESTYGGRLHDDPQTRKQKLLDVFKRIVKARGVLMIPAFAIERTQELLYELNEMANQGLLPTIPVYLDSPLATAVTRVYQQYHTLFDAGAKLAYAHDREIFSFPNLSITESSDQSKAILAAADPKIIIAGSGMMEGGRIIHHAANYLAEPHNFLLFVGYQGQGTLGRELFDGKKQVKIKGQTVKVRAKLMAITAYSSHADQPGLLAWLGDFRRPPQQIALVHGEPEAAAALAKAINLKAQIYRPIRGQSIIVGQT